MKLYILRYSENVFEELKSYRFTRVTPSYALCYTDSEPPKSSAQIFDEDLINLSDNDRKWLQEANLTVLDEYVKEHQEQVEKAQQEFMKEFRNQLEKIRGENIGTNVSEAGAGV